ncbi:MAG TPA: hypothetical protein VL921_17740 [Candidatus Udaeobacter sp.]|nr:hypothetical protein [Candidatus Udaeobacter sp.]
MAGFTTGEPWLKVNPDYPLVNREQSMADEQSLYGDYKEIYADTEDLGGIPGRSV